MMAYYFAYGSNLDAAQMVLRCPGAKKVGVATLHGVRLAFVGRSAVWDGGVATLEAVPGHCVRGLVWKVPKTDLGRLDRYEGHPWCYERVRTKVIKRGGVELAAWVYVHRDPSFAAPGDAYIEQIGRAYRALGFGANEIGALRRAAMGWDK